MPDILRQALAVLATLIFSASAIGLGWLAFGRWLNELDRRAAFGLAGLLGLGLVGLVTLPLGLLPGGLRWGAAVIGGLWILGIIGLVRNRERFRGMTGRQMKGLEALGVLVLAVAVAFSFIGVVTPSTSLDWDSLAYHLAVPKIWLDSGQIEFISFIHHSNFPFVVDNLYIWGMSWGGEAGAKAFELVFLVLGMFTIAGLGAGRYGRAAGLWAAVAFATIPVVLWESGTAYIDVPHGLYAGVGAVLALWSLERSGYFWLGLACLGFAVGSKYTGLQAVAAVGVALLAVGVAVKRPGQQLMHAVILGVGALLLGSPWYVKNAIWAENPVYPFFYEQLGGVNWSQEQADWYREEQQTFGVPRTGPAAGIGTLPHAVFGLAYQPGRYTNPAPQLSTAGTEPSGARGFPFSGVGFVVIAAGLVWMYSGRTRRFEGGLLVWVGVSLLMWFALSQQSRYIVNLAPPLCLLAGGAVVRLRAGTVMGAAIAVQAAASIFMHWQTVASLQTHYFTGSVSREEFSEQLVSFAEPAEFINKNFPESKVALYNEVFGYYLDVPYFWANPGHTSELGQTKAESGAELIARFKQRGLDLIYVSFFGMPREMENTLALAFGFDPTAPLPEGLAEQMRNDPKGRWQWLLADAAQKGLIEPVQAFPEKRSVLLRVVE